MPVGPVSSRYKLSNYYTNYYMKRREVQLVGSGSAMARAFLCTNFECTTLGGFGRFAYLALLPKSPAPDRHLLEDQATDQTVTEHGDDEDRTHPGGVRGRRQEVGDARQPLLRRGLDGEDLRDQVEGGAHAEEGRRHAVRA